MSTQGRNSENDKRYVGMSQGSQVILILGEPFQEDLSALLSSAHLADSLFIIATHKPPAITGQCLPAVCILHLCVPLAVHEDAGAIRLVGLFERAGKLARGLKNSAPRILQFAEESPGGEFCIVEAAKTSSHPQSLSSMPGLNASQRQPKIPFCSYSRHYPRRPFDAILNFLPPNLTEKALLKQTILVSTLCAQYLTLPFESDLGRTMELGSSLDQIVPMTASNLGHASEAHARHSGSSSPTISKPNRRWSALSFLSTTSTSHSSGSTTSAPTQRNANKLKYRVSSLLGRSNCLSVNTPRSGDDVGVGEQGNVEDTSPPKQSETRSNNTAAYLVHILPSSLEPVGERSQLCHMPGARLNPVQEHVDRQHSSPMPISPPLNSNIQGKTQIKDFIHARMQESLVRRVSTMQAHSIDLKSRFDGDRSKGRKRRSSAPAYDERASSSGNGVRSTPSSHKGRTACSSNQPQSKPKVVEGLERFMCDYFGVTQRQGKERERGKGNVVVPFLLGPAAFRLGVGEGTTSLNSRMVLGEAILLGCVRLVDEEVAGCREMRCWIGGVDEDEFIFDDKFVPPSSGIELSRPPCVAGGMPTSASVLVSSGSGSGDESRTGGSSSFTSSGGSESSSSSWVNAFGSVSFSSTGASSPRCMTSLDASPRIPGATPHLSNHEYSVKRPEAAHCVIAKHALTRRPLVHASVSPSSPTASPTSPASAPLSFVKRQEKEWRRKGALLGGLGGGGGGTDERFTSLGRRMSWGWVSGVEGKI